MGIWNYLKTCLTTLEPDVINFFEKPNLTNAKQMINRGQFLWNAGSLFRAQEMIDAFMSYAPQTLDLVSKAVYNATPDLGFLRLSTEPWSMLENISIDYAIMGCQKYSSCSICIKVV